MGIVFGFMSLFFAALFIGLITRGNRFEAGNTLIWRGVAITLLIILIVLLAINDNDLVLNWFINVFKD